MLVQYIFEIWFDYRLYIKYVGILCPATFTNGQISSGCNRYVGSTCGVKCDDGFNAHILSMVCHNNGQWNTDVSHVCTGNIK